MSMEVVGPPAYRSSAESVQLFDPFMGLQPDEFKKLAESILVVLPHRPSEGVNKGLYQAGQIWSIIGMRSATVADEFTGFVEITRAGIVRTFLQYCADHPEVEYCVMIDNDESVDWDAPLRLAQWGKDVVSGIVCSHSEKKGGVFACVTVKDRHGIARFPTAKRTLKLPAKGLREIESAGTGLLCVHKRVLQAMVDADDAPFMIPEDVRKHCCSTGVLKLGEDMAFSERCKKYGFKMYVDFSVHAKHYKTVEISWPKQAIDSGVDAKTWEVSPDDYVHV
jgi:hypothetical protein